jgi:hypothetical protein
MKAPGGSLRQSMLAILLLPTLIVYARLADYPVSRAFGALNYPFQLDNVEGYLLDEAVRISKGEPIYSPITERPFLVGNYPPVYQTAFALFVKFGGQSLAWGRIISLSALAGIAFALFLLALQTGRQVVPASLCPLLFLATFACNNWAAYARVDMLSIFFAFAGIVCFLTEDSRRSRVTAIVFFVLAAMTKQSTLAAPAACALFLLLRDWRKGLVAHGCL